MRRTNHSKYPGAIDIITKMEVCNSCQRQGQGEGLNKVPEEERT